MTHDSSYKLRVNFATTYTLHHCQMFEIIMRLEKSIASKELDKDAPNAPNVTRIAPS